MEKTVLERQPSAFENMFKAPKNERDFEISGVISEIQALPPLGSSVSLMTKDHKKIVLATNKKKEYWLEIIRMGKCVTIKGMHSCSKDGLEQILLVENFSNDGMLKQYAGADATMFDQAKKAVESVSQSYKDELQKLASEREIKEVYENHPSSTVAIGHNDMFVKFLYLFGLYPDEQRNTIKNYLRNYEKASREDKERNDRRLSLLVNYIPGTDDGALKAKAEKVRDVLITEFPGQKTIRNGLIQSLVNFQLDPKHIAPRILIIAKKKADTLRLVYSFFRATNIKFTPFSCSGLSDSVNLVGSSGVYSNSSCGSFGESLRMTGAGGMLFTDLDMATKPEALMPIQSIISGWYANELLETPLDVSKEWVIMTCSNIDKVPLDVSANVIVLEASDYTNEELLCHADCIIREFCIDRSLPTDKFLLSAGVKRALTTKYLRKNDCCGLRKNINALLQNALNHNMEHNDQIKITERNFNQYFPLMEEADHLKNDYLNSIDEVRKKLMLYSDRFPVGIRDCLSRNLDELEGTMDEEKRKCLVKKTLELGNIILTKPFVIDFKKLGNAFDSMYALERIKRMLLDYFFSVSGKENFRFTPIILYGPPGVGKTTLARNIAKALSMPFIYYAFNQMSDPKDLMGYPDYYRSNIKGLLGRMLEYRTTRACVLLDEFDKPITNNAFQVLYNMLDKLDTMDHEYDCSYNTDHVLFILTANDINAIPYSLRNRCECIKVDSYSVKERLDMAKEFILPAAIKKLNIHKKLMFEDDMLRMLLMNYTITGGVREVEVAIEQVLRHLVRTRNNLVVTKELIEECLGIPLLENTNENVNNEVGVAKALAVTGTGGSTFNVITCHNPYGSELEITGLAKDSCLESIKVAMSITSRLMGRPLEHLIIGCNQAGIEKSGPSAGLCFTASMLSCETGIPLGSSGFTGEVSINGRVQPIGGLIDKLTAAERCMLKRVYVPRSNYLQLESEGALDAFDLSIIPVASVQELLNYLFPGYAFPGSL